MAREKSPDYGVLQEFIDRLFDGREDYMRLEVVLEGEAYGLNGELMEVLNLLLLVLYPRSSLRPYLFIALLTDGVIYTARFIRHSLRG